MGGAATGGDPRTGQQHEEVLLIEDDVDVAGMYALGLSLGGHPSRLATSEGAALTQASRGRPAAIVLDLGLRHRDGFEVLARLRHDESTADVPVIVLSFEPDDFAEAYRLGATECLTKQRTTPRKLVERVEGAIRAAS